VGRDPGIYMNELRCFMDAGKAVSYDDEKQVQYSRQHVKQVIIQL
jgi:hypothetical protein